MRRFFFFVVLLFVVLVSIASGVDAALDHAVRSVNESSLVVYDAKGKVVIAYDGDVVGKVPIRSWMLRPVASPLRDSLAVKTSVRG